MKIWNKIQKLASDVGITILGFSSDGDTRLFKSMNIKTFSNNDNLIKINAGDTQTETDTETRSEVYVQDTVHIGAKLRTRVLKPDIELPMSKYIVTVLHAITCLIKINIC